TVKRHGPPQGYRRFDFKETPISWSPAVAIPRFAWRTRLSSSTVQHTSLTRPHEQIRERPLPGDERAEECHIGGGSSGGAAATCGSASARDADVRPSNPACRAPCASVSEDARSSGVASRRLPPS